MVSEVKFGAKILRMPVYSPLDKNFSREKMQACM